jgi:hypothetical protein
MQVPGSTISNEFHLESAKACVGFVRMRHAPFLIALLFLSGCSSLFVEQPKGPWAIIKHESHQCLANLKSDPELKPIAKKVTLDSHYDREEYFDLLTIEELPTSKEKVVIRKWATKLERCYRIKSESYAYEPPGVGMLSAASDSEQLVLIQELAKGSLSYGEFAIRRLDLDTKYRGEIVRAISADYKRQERRSPPKNGTSPNPPASSNSSCGWEANQWICRSL